MKKTVYIECDCHSSEHVLRFTFFPDEKDFIYVETYFKRRGLFVRLKNAALHILGLDAVSSDTTLLSVKTVGELQNLCREFLNK